MLLTIIFKAVVILVGFLLVSVTRFLVHTFAIRLSLRHIPGPAPSSYLWGEEWALYYGTPGAPYVDWHKRFGKIVKFSGAFGVSDEIWLAI